MLFRKKHPKSCQYCMFSASVQEEQVLCAKRGIRQNDAPCRNFRYDPCKRIPPKNAALNFSQYKDEDFSL